ncbi:MAG TPA: phosphatase PAP2 family protein [Thermoleophilaceae bacterium]|nr:phosphatase PAP2 family protein [Thermoleophilaceae bacterium]
MDAPDRSVPLLKAPVGGPAERFAGALRGKHPAAIFFAALVSGYVLLALLAIGLGLLITDVLLDMAEVRHDDAEFVDTLVAERTPFLTDASEVGSTLGGAPLLPILVGLIAIVCAFLRQWLIAGFAVFVLAIESATYRVTSWLVPRERPDVHRLEDLPPDASFPSGHTAAAIAVYVGLVLLITSRFRSWGVRIAAWGIAVAIPVFVALARIYRGMHHPLDAAGGLVIGIGALIVIVFACRAAGVAAEGHSKVAHPTRRRRPQPAS